LEAVKGAWRIGDPGEPILDGGPLIAERISR
jgi:thymidine phosphorylase